MNTQPALTSDLLFVYGSLKQHPKRSRYPSADQVMALKAMASHGTYMGRAQTKGRLVDCGGYPALISGPRANHWVEGELYKIKNASLLFRALDKYEGCNAQHPKPHEYRRESIQCVWTPSEPSASDNISVYAWCYLFNHRG